MKKLIVFRFDIDSHLCLSEGVPNLIALAEKFNVKFTFFANPGRAIHYGVQLRNRLGPKSEVCISSAPSLSAKRRLGVKGFVQTLLWNPKLAENWPEKLRLISEKGHELGLHGGMNHDKWHHDFANMIHSDIVIQIQKGLEALRTAVPGYEPFGFSSPGWSSSSELPEILKSLGFSYFADDHFDFPVQEVEMKSEIYSMPTNMLAQPGGVALIEHWFSKGYSKEEMLAEFERMLFERQKLAVFYEHPCFAGREALPVLSDMIKRALDLNYEFVCFKDLIGAGYDENCSSFS